MMQLQDLGSSIPNSDNSILNYLQNTGIQDEIQVEEGNNENNDSKNEDNDIDDQDVDYSSSSSRDDDEKVDEKDFVEELHDRVLDQVTEQLRKSGIDFPQ
jgi:hypothetical protein